MPAHGATAASVVLCLLGVATAAQAQSPPEEGFTPSSSLSMGARVSVADAADKLGGLGSLGAMDIRFRALLGQGLGYCAGGDATIGASGEGVVYGAEAYVLGAGLRFGDSNFIAACAGAGVGKATGAIPFAWQFPAELTAELQTGPVRVQLWGKAIWTAGEDARLDGSNSLSIVDELSAGVALRLGRPTHYWKTTTASHGYFVGAQYQELMGTHMIGFALGVGLWGGR